MRATPGSWKSEPFPADRARLKLEQAFSAAEWDALQQGVIPEEMEDKWFIYEERGWLYFHRSWTGFCVFRVWLKKTPTGGEIAEAWVNRNKEQYTCVDDAYDAQLLSWLIDVLLLKRPALFPDSGQLDGMEPLRQWSSVGRAMLAHDNDGRAAAGLDEAMRKSTEDCRAAMGIAARPGRSETSVSPLLFHSAHRRRPTPAPLADLRDCPSGC